MIAEVMRDALLRDVRGRAKLDRRLTSIDFIFFTGDLSYSGIQQEFSAASKYLLDPILNVVRLEPNDIFIVPGNHDFDRSLHRRYAPPELRTPFTSDAVLQNWLTNDADVSVVLQPFRDFTTFASTYCAQESPAFASVRLLEAGTIKIALVGLNSSWMSNRENSSGLIPEYGTLLIGEPQARLALEQAADAEIRIAAMHHSFDWLADFDRARVKASIERSVNFIVYGHEHTTNATHVRGPGREYIAIPGGALYSERTPRDPRHICRYNLTTIDLANGEGSVFFRRWSDIQSEWIADTDTAERGRYDFRLSRRSLPSSYASGPTAPIVDTQAAMQEYQNHLLAVCEIIDLASLPEDMRLAHRKLQIRSLYVPLQAFSRDNSAESPASATQESLWQDLERARSDSVSGRTSPAIESSGERVGLGDLLSRHKRLMVLGDPGAGKTTFTRWLVTSFLLRQKKDAGWNDVPDVRSLPDADLNPILVRCRHLDKQALTGSLRDILLQTLRKAERGPTVCEPIADLLISKLAAGEAFVIFDGLDEISDVRDRASFCKQIDEVSSAYPLAHIIATSRIVGYREIGNLLRTRFEHVTIADLTSFDKDRFAENWCGLTESSDRRSRATIELIADIHSSDRIERLTGNPMLLTTMALVKRRLSKLPQQRAELYWQAVQVLLNWRPEIDSVLDASEAIPQLAYVAYVMCERGTPTLNEDELLRLLSQMRREFVQLNAIHRRDPKALLGLLEARTGIIVQSGFTNEMGRTLPVYEFRHLTFQEYLAALALVHGYFPERDAEQSLAECVRPIAARIATAQLDEDDPPPSVTNWREALRLVTSICHYDDVDPVIRTILNAPAGQPSVASTYQAALCLADEPNATDRAAIEVLESVASHYEDLLKPDRARGTGRGAISELSATHWGDKLRGLLAARAFGISEDAVEDFFALLPEAATGMIPLDPAAVPRWLRACARVISGDEQHAAFFTCIAVMRYTHASIYIDKSNQSRPRAASAAVARSLLSRLFDTGPIRYVAIWALGWLSWGHRWKPTSEEERRLLAVAPTLTLPSEKFWAAHIIRSLNIRAGHDFVKAWANSDSRRVFSGAIEALGALNDVESLQRLVMAASPADSDSTERSRPRSTIAAEQLWAISSRQSLEVLLKLAINGFAEAVADAMPPAWRGLGRKTIEILTKLDVPLQTGAVTAIAAIRDKKVAVKALRLLANAPPGFPLSEAAAQELSLFGIKPRRQAKKSGAPAHYSE